jgi:hypothetical protein
MTDRWRIRSAALPGLDLYAVLRDNLGEKAATIRMRTGVAAAA